MDVYVANSPSFKVDPNTVASDAFGRMRVSTPENVFDSKNLPDKNPLFWTEYQAGGAAAAAWQVNKSQVNLTVTGASQTSIRQTTVHPVYISMITGNDPVYWELLLNPTVTFSTPASYESASFSLTEGAVEADIVGVSSGITGGYVVASGLISTATRGEHSEFDSLLKMCADYAGTSDVLVLSGMGLTGTSASYPTMSWREFV